MCVDVQANVTAVQYNKEVLSWMIIIFVYTRGYINNVSTSFPVYLCTYVCKYASYTYHCHIPQLGMCLHYSWDQSIVIHGVSTRACVCIYSLGPLRVC